MHRVRISVNSFPEERLGNRPPGRAFLGVSLNNRVTADPRLLAEVFEWTRLNVGAFDLVLGDYLHRHNFQAFNSMLEPAAIKQAMKEGAQTTERLQDLAAQRGIRGMSIISGGALSAHSDFRTRIARFERHYLTHEKFRARIDEATASFLARKHPGMALDATVRAHCTAYQLEELAIFEMLAEKGYGTFVYPGAQLPVMKDLVSGSLDGVSHALEALTLIEIRLFEDSTL